MNYQITLTTADITHAAAIALARDRSARKRRRKNTHGAEWSDSLDWHRIGAYGEVALALLTGHAINQECVEKINHRLPDVGPYDVRTSPLPFARLILHPKDPDYRVFILALTCDFPTIRFAGWIWSHHAKKQEFWLEPKPSRPAYWIPQSKLRPLSELQDFRYQQ